MNSVAAARGSIVAHCAAIRHNAGGQLSPAVQSASEARLDGEFWRFGVAQISMLSQVRCSARKARRAYATRVLSVRLFSAPFLSEVLNYSYARDPHPFPGGPCLRRRL